MITITGRDLRDGEEFEVSDIKWDGTRLSASFRMPSTGHTTHSTLSVVSQDVLLDEYRGGDVHMSLEIKDLIGTQQAAPVDPNPAKYEI